jgi:1,4-dihydroxy-2-naphthoate octaprenyltransferase
MHARTLLQTIRPSFLILSPVCVFLGTGTAIAAQGTVNTATLVLIMIAAVCAHVSVNTLNEYADFRSGLDLVTVRTPFSGGSGALPADPAMANTVLLTGMFTLFTTTAIGLYFISGHGTLILPIGVIGIVIILAYTRWINRWPLLCLAAPGFGFGILMVTGSHFLLTGSVSATAWLAALVPFFLVNNLLLLNQYPDIEADRSIGRNHLPIAYGTTTSSAIYGLQSLSAGLVILVAVYAGYFPHFSLLAALPLLLSLFSLTGALKHGGNIGRHQKYLAANVAATLFTPFILGITLIYD